MPLSLAQRRRRDDAAGREAAIAQQLRQQPVMLCQAEAAVAADARLEREPAREERGMRRQRFGRVGIGALEQDAVGRQPVDRRRLHTLVAVGREVIRAQRIDRDHDHRSADRRRRARVPPAACRRQAHGRGGDDEYEGIADGAPYFFSWSTTAFACAASGDDGSTSITLLNASIAPFVSPLLSATLPSANSGLPQRGSSCVARV